jgi:hypothetical protein
MKRKGPGRKSEIRDELKGSENKTMKIPPEIGNFLVFQWHGPT